MNTLVSSNGVAVNAKAQRSQRKELSKSLERSLCSLRPFRLCVEGFPSVPSPRRAVQSLVLAFCALILTGCGSSGGGSSNANMRFFNAVVGGTPVSVSVGSNSAASSLGFEGLTTYVQVDSGTQQINVMTPGGTSPIITQTTFTDGDVHYTYLMYGTASAPTAQLIADALTLPGSGQSMLRATNAAFGSAAFDVYVTTPGASLDSASPNISNIAVNTTSAFATLASGALQVRLTLNNSKQVIYDAGTVTFSERSAYYLVAYTKGSSTLVNAALLNMDIAGSGAVANSTLAQFKMVHAAPGTAAINTLIDGTVTLANLPYQGVSSYLPLAAGTHDVTVETVTSPGATIASAQPPFPSSTDTSIVVTGTPGAQTAVVLADNNLPGTSGSARVRFVNVASNLGAVDVLVNFARKVSALGTNAASGYVELAEDTYAIDFDPAGTTNVVLNVPQVSVDAGGTYTLYLVGTGTQLAGVLTRDD
jgi:Domain of unknown function (DUF4397)